MKAKRTNPKKRKKNHVLVRSTVRRALEIARNTSCEEGKLFPSTAQLFGLNSLSALEKQILSVITTVLMMAENKALRDMPNVTNQEALACSEWNQLTKKEQNDYIALHALVARKVEGVKYGLSESARTCPYFAQAIDEQFMKLVMKVRASVRSEDERADSRLQGALTTASTYAECRQSSVAPALLDALQKAISMAKDLFRRLKEAERASGQGDV